MLNFLTTFPLYVWSRAYFTKLSQKTLLDTFSSPLAFIFGNFADVKFECHNI